MGTRLKIQMMAQQKKDCEETCDYSDASAAIKQEGLERERDWVIALSFMEFTLMLCFHLAHQIIRLANYQRMYLRVIIM